MPTSTGPNLHKLINALTGDSFDADFRAFLRMVDDLVQCAVKSKTLSAPPGSPANGDRYIIGPSPTGAWAGSANAIAVWTTDNPASPSGVWEEYTPNAGWLVYNVADTTFYYYSGSAWVALSSGGGGGSSTLAGDTDVALSSPTNGQVLTYDSTSSKWKNAAAGGGGGGGTYPVVGTPLLPGNRGTGTVNGLNGYTLWAQVPGNKLATLAATWKVVIAAIGGTGVSINKAFVVRTLPGDLVPIDSTQIKFGGSNSYAAAFGSTPTPSNPAFVTSDAIALQLDTAHDYWVCYFFDNDGTGYNAALYITANPLNPQSFGQYQSGDHTANNPITCSLYNIQAPLFWDFVFDS